MVNRQTVFRVGGCVGLVTCMINSFAHPFQIANFDKPSLGLFDNALASWPHAWPDCYKFGLIPIYAVK